MFLTRDLREVLYSACRFQSTFSVETFCIVPASKPSFDAFIPRQARGIGFLLASPFKNCKCHFFLFIFFFCLFSNSRLGLAKANSILIKRPLLYILRGIRVNFLALILVLIDTISLL